MKCLMTKMQVYSHLPDGSFRDEKRKIKIGKSCAVQVLLVLVVQYKYLRAKLSIEHVLFCFVFWKHLLGHD